MCTCAIFGSQNVLSMHVCKFSKGNACDVGSKYTLEVHIRDLGNEGALIVHGCIFLVRRISCASECS